MNDDAMPVPAAAPPAAFAPAPPPPSRLLRLARRHQRTVLACLVVALLLGVLAQLLLPRSFESRAQIYIEEPSPHPAVARLTGPAGLPSTHAARIKTTPVLRAALASDAVGQLPSITQRGEGAIAHLEKKLRTSVPAGGETVNVRYRSRSAQDAATVLTAVIEAYIAQLNADRGVSPADPADAPAGLADAPAPRIMDEQVMAERLSELAGRLARAEADAGQAAARVAQAEAAGDDALALAALIEASGADSQLLGAAELAYLATELKKLERQLESMPASWGPGHAVRGPVQRRVDAMRYEVDAQNDQAAHAMRAALERSHAVAARNARELADAFEETQAAAASSARPPIRVIQWPEVARRPAAPRVLSTLAIAVFGGLGLALALIFRRELRDLPEDAPVYTPPAPAAGYALGYDQQAAPAEPRALLADESVEVFSAQQGAPVLGQMPEVPRTPTGGGGAPVFDDPAAAIHQIRAVLQVQATARGTRAFAFTSPERGAGKTSVALGVASSLALSGTRTLVVDCDLAGRIARNHEANPFADPAALPPAGESGAAAADPAPASGPNPGPSAGPGPNPGNTPLGITGLIDGHPLSECVAESSTAGLSLLPAVNPQAAHISKLSDGFIRRLIDTARDYDMVIFDTGPVPGSVEALLVASQCDGVVVVVQSGQDRKALDRTFSYLKVVGAKITGTVLNRVTGAAAPPAVAASPDGSTDPASPAAAGPGLEPGPKPNPRGRSGSVGVPLGSGIFAAAVFSDADGESDLVADTFESKPTGDFNGSGKVSTNGDGEGTLADVFGAVADDDPATS